MSHETHLTLVLDAAQRAGALIMTGWRGRPEIHHKSTIDLVTDFDVKSENLIREVLASSSNIPMVGEESSSGALPESYWCVDPIDGTTNFAHGHPFFCVSIALVEGGIPTVGVVFAPALGITWTAIRGGAATRNGQPMRVSSRAPLGQSLGATGFPYDVATSDDNNLKEFNRIQRLCRGVRRCGAAAIDLAMVADGTYDFFWEQKLKPWDIAAGIVLVEAAGGIITGYRGEPFCIGVDHRLTASNPRVHPELITALD